MTRSQSSSCEGMFRMTETLRWQGMFRMAETLRGHVSDGARPEMIARTRITR